MTNGPKLIGYGIIIALLGFVMFTLYHFNVIQQDYMMTGAKVLGGIGATLFILGFLMSFKKGVTGEKQIHQQDAAISAVGLMRSMIAVSIADDHLDDSEIAIIQKIYKQLMGTDMSKELIIEAADEMKTQGIGITEELERIRGTLPPDLKLKIVKASLYILAADGVLDEAEERVMTQIREGLRLPKGKFEKIKKKFLESRQLKQA